MSRHGCKEFTVGHVAGPCYNQNPPSTQSTIVHTMSKKKCKNILNLEVIVKQVSNGSFSVDMAFWTWGLVSMVTFFLIRRPMFQICQHVAFGKAL